MGKTSLALQYAKSRAADYQVIWWVPAESDEQIDAALGDLAGYLHPAWALAAPSDVRTEWALRWLHEHRGRWLIIYDNAEDPVVLNPRISRLLGRGHQLVTTRKADGWHSETQTICLDVLDPEPAADLLCRVALPNRSAHSEERKQATWLAADLGRLPLALAQAAAYLHQTGLTFEEYRAQLGQTPDAVWVSGAVDETAAGTIRRIWQMSLPAIRRRHEFAVDLLNMLVWYAPEPFPTDLLRPLGDAGHNVGEALEVLSGYNLVTLGEGSVAVHRLLRTALRAELGAAAYRAQARRLMACSFVDTGSSTSVAGSDERLWMAGLRHVQALADTEQPSDEAVPEISPSTAGLHTI